MEMPAIMAMGSIFNIEERGNAAVGWQKGPKHTHYEDRYRLLCAPVPLVVAAGRGEILAVCDGVGSAPKGMSAAQEICDALLRFFDPSRIETQDTGVILSLLTAASQRIVDWGMIEGTDRPLGACAATVIWLNENRAHVFHAGDTCAVLIRDGAARALTRAHQDTVGHLLNYFGNPSLQIEEGAYEIEVGDRLLLTSDGISKVLYPQAMADTVESSPTRSTGLVALLGQARARGSGDDMTALLMDIE